MHEPFRQHFRYLASGVVIGQGKGERERERERGEEKRTWVKRGSEREREVCGGREKEMMKREMIEE